MMLRHSLILFQNIVPISLIITIDLVKTIQAFFIHSDVEMYYEPLDQPCVPKTWNISDDLGQISYIFSDKTGTLTQNVMELQRCAIGGTPYGDGLTEAMLGAAKRNASDTSELDTAHNAEVLQRTKAGMLAVLKKAFKNKWLQEASLTLVSVQLAEHLTQRCAERLEIREFWTALALCHTVVAERSDDRERPYHLNYKAESPDEAALVAAARDIGFVFVNRSTTEVEIEVTGTPESYTLLRVLEFNSTRKRMSIILRRPDNRIWLISKGADSVIYERLHDDHDLELKNSTAQLLDDFAAGGLRTLVVASKALSEEEYQTWVQQYDEACASLADREERVERVCDGVERGLTILGATALEDKLQEGVPEAIERLHSAGCRIFVLTGDKLQTAIEIGFSCNLLSKEMDIMIISAESHEGTQAQIIAALDKVNLATAGMSSEVPPGGYAIVIDGDTLRHALDDSVKGFFLELSTQCETVICCRVSPSQKARVVKLVKDGKNAVTLAIGDGANDVAMLQEAHIGVGIAGLEGAQASMSADYAIGQFRFLTRLLIVHGRWSYSRIAWLSSTFFYKNLNYVFTLFLYQIWANFDGTYLLEYSLLLLFNLAFTSLPVAILGIVRASTPTPDETTHLAKQFDQDVRAETAMSFPQLYRSGIEGKEYTRARFFEYLGEGIYQASVCFFIPLGVYGLSTSLAGGGHDWTTMEFGTTVAACSVTSANLFVGLHIRAWTAFVFVVIIGSCLTFFAWVAIYSWFPTFFFYRQMLHLFPTLNFWLSLVLTQVAAIGPRFVFKYVQSAYYPTDLDIVREYEIRGNPIHLPRTPAHSPIITNQEVASSPSGASDIPRIQVDSWDPRASLASTKSTPDWTYASLPTTASSIEDPSPQRKDERPGVAF